MNRLLSALALLTLLAFLAVYLVRVPRIDLGIVVLITMGLAIFDIWSQLWRNRGR